ncbi:MAG: toll/interleukin-1 receptor domain-containing protein [Gemmatimonadaceae bacterium]
MRAKAVCVIHSSADNLVARRLASDLVAIEISARADMFEMSRRDSLPKRMEIVLGCHVFVVILSENALQSDWLPVTFSPELFPPLKRGWVFFARLDDAVPPETITVGDGILDFSDYAAGFAALREALIEVVP